MRHREKMFDIVMRNSLLNAEGTPFFVRVSLYGASLSLSPSFSSAFTVAFACVAYASSSSKLPAQTDLVLNTPCRSVS